jgi:hypothetical protein
MGTPPQPDAAQPAAARATTLSKHGMLSAACDACCCSSSDFKKWGRPPIGTRGVASDDLCLPRRALLLSAGAEPA